MREIENGFYVVAREAGAERDAIPAWACRERNPAALAATAPQGTERVDIDAVPGAFQLLGVLRKDECERLIALGENCGYLADAAVSLGRDIRHNDSFTWIADDTTVDILWRRCAQWIEDGHEYDTGKPAVGLNARFRFYRYRLGDYFAPHTDGSWPGSRVVDGELVDDAWGDRWSQLTLLLFLSDGYAGGATRFYVDDADPPRPVKSPAGARIVDVRTPLGGALCFPHGLHPLHCLHASEKITAGVKYILRSDVLFAL